MPLHFIFRFIGLNNHVGFEGRFGQICSCCDTVSMKFVALSCVVCLRNKVLQGVANHQFSDSAAWCIAQGQDVHFYLATASVTDRERKQLSACWILTMFALHAPNNRTFVALRLHLCWHGSKEKDICIDTCCPQTRANANLRKTKSTSMLHRTRLRDSVLFQLFWLVDTVPSDMKTHNCWGGNALGLNLPNALGRF